MCTMRVIIAFLIEKKEKNRKNESLYDYEQRSVMHFIIKYKTDISCKYTSADIKLLPTYMLKIKHKIMEQSIGILQFGEIQKKCIHMSLIFKVNSKFLEKPQKNIISSFGEKTWVWGVNESVFTIYSFALFELILFLQTFLMSKIINLIK